MKKGFLEELAIYTTKTNIIPISLEILVVVNEIHYITMTYYHNGDIISENIDYNSEIVEIFNMYNIPIETLTYISESIIPYKRIIFDKRYNHHFYAFVYASDDKYLLCGFSYFDNYIRGRNILHLWKSEYYTIDYTIDNLNIINEL